MNQKNLFLSVIFFLLLINFSFADSSNIENGSFEIYSNAYNTLAYSWIQVAGDYYGSYNPVTETCASLGPGTAVIPSAYGRMIDPTAPNGSYSYFMLLAEAPFVPGTFSEIYSDYYIGTLTEDTKFCYYSKSNIAGKGPIYSGIYFPTSNDFCIVGGGYGGDNITGDWNFHCTDTFVAGEYKGYFALMSVNSYNADSSTVNIDNVFRYNQPIVNYTSITALSDVLFSFKIKIRNPSTLEWVTTADVNLVSNDFNSIMVYNSSSGYYETTHTFSNKFGDYNFTVNVEPFLTFSGDSKQFSTTFVKQSNFIINISNTVVSNEWQYSDSLFSVNLTPVDNSTDLIYYFNGSGTDANSADFNFTIFNVDVSNKRYFVYTATEYEYSLGQWNFDSTLTFGSTIYNGIQKIFIDSTLAYEYFFEDVTLTKNQKKYYKLVYRDPFKFWQSLDPNFNSDWDVQLLPSVYQSETGHKRDYFAVSAYNNMRNQFKTELPDINSNETYSKFLLIFNGSIDSGTYSIQAGKNNGGTLDTVSDISLTTIEKTFAVSTGWKFPLIKSDSTSFKQIMLSDYALIERSFFLTPLSLNNKDNSVIEAELVNGVSSKVILEGEKFRIKTTLYNRDNELSFLETKVYFGSVSPANQISYFKQDLNFLATNEIYSLDWLVDGIFDLNGTAPQNFIVVVKATNIYNDWFEIQTTTFKLRQFPSYSDEFNLNFYITNKKVGEHLSGVVQINTDNPDVLRGLTFRLWKPDTQSIETNDYNLTLFKGNDFVCTGFNCTFNFTFLDHVLDDQVIWALNISALLTTQLEDTNSFLTAKTIRFSVYYSDFNYMRIVETMERVTHTYKHTEPIPLTLILVRGDKQPTKDQLKIVLRAANCSTDAIAGTCTDIDINYSADSYVYDTTTGENFYFWRQIYVDQDLSLFDDGDYYRFYAIVESTTGKFSGVVKPLLSAKCQTYTAGGYGQIVLHFLFGDLTGCTVNTAEIVSIDSNSQESRILIDRDLITSKPNLEFTICLNADQNNNYKENLKQDLLCVTGYTFNEAPIDKFDFYLTNQSSDLSKKVSSERQFIKATMPFPLLALNDIVLMRQSLKQEYQTEVTTIGGLIQQGFNYLFTGFANPLLNGVFTDNSMAGTINNIGADFNLNKPLDPTYIGGLVFFKIKGIKVLNQQDLIRQYPDEKLDKIKPEELIKYLNYKQLSYSVEPTTIEIYGSDMKKLLTVQDTAPLIINEEFSKNSYSKTDENKNFESLPTKLKFSVLTDMWYDDELHVKKTTVPITITALITKQKLYLSDVSASLDLLISDPAEWIGQNIFFILIILALLVIISVIYYNFRAKK